MGPADPEGASNAVSQKSLKRVLSPKIDFLISPLLAGIQTSLTNMLGFGVHEDLCVCMY